jgi:regulator of sirC expression with transglutaminase-like and TPR domain
MSLAATTRSPEDLSENQRLALIKLLADDDHAVYRTVRAKLVSYGPPAATWLRPFLTDDDPVLRRRAQGIVLHFGRDSADDEFLGFCVSGGQNCDLERGAWLFARTRYPQINREGYQALLDLYAAEVGDRMVGRPRASEVLAVLNGYLFEELGYVGNEEDYYDPENSYLNRVMDRRTGNPVNLCLVYLLVARRVGLPITGIGLPGHFLCRYQTSAAEIYVDPFNRGKLLTKADCIQYLAQGNFGMRDDYLSPISPRRMLLRICANLHQVYTHLRRQEEATRIQRYMVALART